MKNCCSLIKNFFQLELYALKRARNLVENNYFEHELVGENVYKTWLANFDDWSFFNFGKEATDEWYNEIMYYDFSEPGFYPSAHQFTQVVWKDTTKLGCAAARGEKTGEVYVVCNYHRPGNLDLYEENVFPKKHFDSSNGGYDTFRGYYDLPNKGYDSFDDHYDLPNGHFDTTSNIAEVRPVTRDCLETHNAYRAEHGVPYLSYDEEVSSV